MDHDCWKMGMQDRVGPYSLEEKTEFEMAEEEEAKLDAQQSAIINIWEGV